jgi:two-component system response regulator CpxR
LRVFRQGGIDLVLSDLTMPHMDGNELARRMKEIAPEVPILLMSGSP